MHSWEPKHEGEPDWGSGVFAVVIIVIALLAYGYIIFTSLRHHHW